MKQMDISPSEWNPLGIAGMITAIGGVLGVIIAALRQRNGHSNGNGKGTEQTLTGAFTLINTLQEERTECNREIAVLKSEVTELKTTQQEHEAELRTTKDEIYNLKQEISGLKRGAS